MTPTIEGAEPAPARRPRPRTPGAIRWVAAAAVIALVAGLLWTRTRAQPPSASLARALRGTLVYSSAGDDGATGRLWRVNVSEGTATEGPRTVLPDEIVAAGSQGIGVRAGGRAYEFPDLDPESAPLLLAEGQLVAWAPGGNAVFVVTRTPARGRCPTLHIDFVDALSHGAQDLYDEPTCDRPDGLAVDGLARPFLSLAGRTNSGVFELGYRKLHRVVPEFSLLAVSPVGDMLVGPRIESPAGVADGSAPVLRTLLAWQGVGGPTAMGTARHDLRAERFLAWSADGHRAAVLGTLGTVRSIWLLDIDPGAGRRTPHRVAPELPKAVTDVGAAFAGGTLLETAEGKLYASDGRGYREIGLPDGAPAPSGPILWLDR